VNKIEITKLVERIGTMRNSFMNQQNVSEWSRILASLDYNKANELVTYFLRNADECPTIAAYLREYDKSGNATKYVGDRKHGEPKCWVCMDRGYVFYWQRWGKNDYEYVAYCDLCDAGQKVFYDGRSLPKKGDRNPYVTPPVSQMSFDTKEIAKNNRERYENDHKMPDRKVDIKEIKGKIGAMPW